MKMNTEAFKYGTVLLALTMVTGLGASQTVGDNEINTNLTSPDVDDSPYTLGTDDGIDVEGNMEFGSKVSNMSYTVNVSTPSGVPQVLSKEFTLIQTDVGSTGNISFDETVLREEIEEEDIPYAGPQVLFEVVAEGEDDSGSTVTSQDSVIVGVQEPTVDIVSPEDNSTVELSGDETKEVEIHLGGVPQDAENVTVTLAENTSIDENTTKKTLVDKQISEVQEEIFREVQQKVIEAEFGLSDVSEFESDKAVVDVELTGSNLSESVTKQSEVTVEDTTGIIGMFVGTVEDTTGVNLAENNSALLGGGFVVGALLAGLSVVGYRRFG